MPNTKKIAIIGGGVSGCTTAYALTCLPELEGKYEVTIFQMGHMLGGKGASYRIHNNNEGDNNRSIEHGPHSWFGSYSNTWRIYETIYKEYLQDNNFKFGIFDSLRNQNSGKPIFSGCRESIIYKEYGDEISHWKLITPEFNLNAKISIFHRVFETVKLNLEAIPQSLAHKDGVNIVGEITDYLARAANSVVNKVVKRLILVAIGKIRDASIEIKGLESERLYAMEVLLLMNVALIDYYKLNNTKDRITITNQLDQYDLREFLREKYDCSKEVLDSSFLKSLYDTYFSYTNRDSDALKPSFSVGSALTTIIWLLQEYKGFSHYKMNAGMGEVAFIPMYTILKKKGVKFNFFHKLESVSLDDNNAIKTLIFKQQGDANTLGENNLFYTDNNGMKCWKPSPLGNELSINDNPENTLEQHINIDFDHVVMATPLTAIKLFGQELIKNEYTLGQSTKLHSSHAVSAQIWLKKAAESQLHLFPNITEPFILSGVRGTWNIFIDYSAVLKTENNSNKDLLIYACGVRNTKNNEDHSLIKKDLKNQLFSWLDSTGIKLWPQFENQGIFDRNLLQDKDIHISSNHLPTDQYMMAAKGTTRFRFRNHQLKSLKAISFAGDWMETGINVGCVEAATISGLQAAEHVSGEKLKIDYPSSTTQ